jgi:hypothetical protein
MSKKFDNKILLYVFLALIIIFAGVKLYNLKFTDSTLNTKIVDIDTSRVTKLLLYPTTEKRDEIKFYKEGKDWKLSKGKLIVDPESNAIQNFFALLLNIKVQRLASKEKSKWPEYNLTDTAATRVKVYQGDKLTLDLYIGKFNYQRSNDPYQMYGRGISGSTFVRLGGEPEVYVVDGFLTFTFNQQFNSFRKQSIARLEKEKVNKLTFKYPGDSSFTISQSGKNWMIGDQKADSAKMAEYLNSLNYKNSSSFDDNFVPSGMAQYNLIIEGKDMKTLAIDGYVRANDSYILNSNQNSKSWFSSPYKGLFTEIFKSKKSFFKDEKKKK